MLTNNIPPEEFWILWDRFYKVTFSGENKLILVNPFVEKLSVKEDVYSEWKRWANTGNNIRFEFALRGVGGLVTNGVHVYPTFFLLNGWKIKVPVSHHSFCGRPSRQQQISGLTIDGNIFSEDGGSIFAV